MIATLVLLAGLQVIQETRHGRTALFEATDTSVVGFDIGTPYTETRKILVYSVYAANDDDQQMRTRLIYILVRNDGRSTEYTLWGSNSSTDGSLLVATRSSLTYEISCWRGPRNTVEIRFNAVSSLVQKHLLVTWRLEPWVPTADRRGGKGPQ